MREKISNRLAENRGRAWHGTDEFELCQLLTYRDDVDPNAKLDQWKRYCNCHRRQGALKGKSAYELLPERMKWQEILST